MLYSKSTGGFYDHEINAGRIPEDAVEISRSAYDALLDGQSCGKQIVSDQNGYPVLIDPPEPSASDLIKRQISSLESAITPRRLRESVLGADGGWLAGIDQQIADLRAQL